MNIRQKICFGVAFIFWLVFLVNNAYFIIKYDYSNIGWGIVFLFFSLFLHIYIFIDTTTKREFWHFVFIYGFLPIALIVLSAIVYYADLELSDETPKIKTVNISENECINIISPNGKYLICGNQLQNLSGAEK